jgi:CheY-like chemotaxis protein
MSLLSAHGSRGAVRHERVISALSDRTRTGLSGARARVLSAQELARLEPSARVRSYLPVLAASSVREIMRRKRRPRLAGIGRAGSPAAAQHSKSDHATGATVRSLIVDDDAGSARTLARMLQESGHHQTRIVHSAASALEAAVEYAPGIGFVDIELPDMSGYDLALRLHQHPRLQEMRLIALTDSDEHPQRERARASGFERYLVKPVSVTALNEVLDPSSQ